MQDSIKATLPRAEVLIHVEPETSLRPPGETEPMPVGLTGPEGRMALLWRRQEIDSCRKADGAHRDGVSGVAADRKEDGGDRANDDDDDP